MYFNEELQGAEYNDTSIQAIDLDIDAAADLEDIHAEGCGSKDEKCSEAIDLDYDVLDDQTDVEDTVHEGYDCDNCDEDVDLDYDALRNNGFKVDSTPYTSTSAIDLDFDVLDDQTDVEDTVHECDDLPIVEDISFSESAVRVFQRSDYNLITESDVNAVMNYYGNELITEDEAVERIARFHNLELSEMVILYEGLNPINKSKTKKVKAVKGNVSRIASLQDKKAKLINRRKQLELSKRDTSMVNKQIKRVKYDIDKAKGQIF